MMQRIITNFIEVSDWLKENNSKTVLLVCGDSIRYMESLNQVLKNAEDYGTKFIKFKDFQPNPQYESVVKGVRQFRKQHCDSIIAVGGGSAIDVAKCIKAYANMSGNGDNRGYLEQNISPNGIPFLVIPTTAGTGSEATRFAVIYFEGEKKSITSESFIPETVLMNPQLLSRLPMYQRKSTMMDALCHAIESFWSVNSTELSKKYSREAIQNILAFKNGYLQNTEEGNAGMMMAAHIAGKAINITQTTAGHAMCYKLTSLYGIAHGHATILCDRVLYPWMIKNIDKCIDPRGQKYLKQTLNEIGEAMGCTNASEGAMKLQQIFQSLELEIPKASDEQYQQLAVSVNPVRLRNHPIVLDDVTINNLYHKILR